MTPSLELLTEAYSIYWEQSAVTAKLLRGVKRLAEVAPSTFTSPIANDFVERAVSALSCHSKHADVVGAVNQLLSALASTSTESKPCV